MNTQTDLDVVVLPQVLGMIQMCLRRVVKYLCGGLCVSCSGLPPCYPPCQRARVSPSQLSLLWFLGGYKLNQFDQQPLCQLPLPVWTERLLPLQRCSSQIYIRVTKQEPRVQS